MLISSLHAIILKRVGVLMLAVFIMASVMLILLNESDMTPLESMKICAIAAFCATMLSYLLSAWLYLCTKCIGFWCIRNLDPFIVGESFEVDQETSTRYRVLKIARQYLCEKCGNRSDYNVKIIKEKI